MIQMVPLFKALQTQTPHLLPEFKNTLAYFQTGERLRFAWAGDAVVRLHVRLFLRERFRGRASLNDFECFLNSNDWMGQFLGRHISEIQSTKAKADVFESFVYYLHQRNKHTEFLNNYCLFHLTPIRIKEYDMEPICPLVRQILRK